MSFATSTRRLRCAPIGGTLIFDGDCGLCQACVTWASRHTGDAVRYLPYQTADLATWGLKEHDCASAVQWVGSDAASATGAAAVSQVLLATGRYAPAGRALQVPGIRTVAALVYRFVARHRRRVPLGGQSCRLPAARGE